MSEGSNEDEVMENEWTRGMSMDTSIVTESRPSLHCSPPHKRPIDRSRCASRGHYT